MNDMGSLSFKCIFDPDKTISKLIPDHLVIQHENEYENNYRKILKPVDCFINVAKSSIANNKVEGIRRELEPHDLKRAENPQNELEYSEYLERRKANGIHNTVEGKGLQKRKLKRVINTKDGAEIEIYYRSIAEDKQFKTQKFQKVTKIVTSEKTIDIIPDKNKMIKDILNLRKHTACRRSIKEDKIFKAKNYRKITKRLKSKSSSGKVTLTKNTNNKIENLFKGFCNDESVGCASSVSESCYSKSLRIENNRPEVNEDIATNGEVSTIASIETDHKKLSTAVLEEQVFEIKDSIENNMLESTNAVNSVIATVSNENPEHKSKHSLFDEFSTDNLLENVLFQPRYIYA